MRKAAATLTVTTLVLGIFGAFFRWLQNINAFEAETGLLKPFHGTTIVFLIYCVVAIAAIAVLSFGWMKRYAGERDVTALRSTTPVPAVLGWVLGVGFVLAAVILLFTADFSANPMAQRLFGAAGIFGGLCFPFLPGRLDGRVNSIGRTAAAVAVLFCCCWLIFCYYVNRADPVIFSFAVEILAIASTAVAFYYIAAFHYGAGQNGRALLAVQLASFFNVTALFDSRRLAFTAMLLIAAAMTLMFEFLLVENMRDKQ